MLVRGAILLVAIVALTANGCGGYRGTDDADCEAEATRTSVAPAVSPTLVASPASAPTPEPDCPVDEELCEYARRVESLLHAGLVDELLDDSRGVPTICPNGVNEGLDETFPLCEGATPGEIRYGFKAGTFQAEGYTTDRDGTKEIISGWARDPRVRAYTIGCKDAAPAPRCEGLFTLVLSVPASTDRPFLGLVVKRSDGPEEIVATYNGYAMMQMFGEYVDGGLAEIGVDPLDPSTGPTRFVLLPQ